MEKRNIVEQGRTPDIKAATATDKMEKEAATKFTVPLSKQVD